MAAKKISVKEELSSVFRGVTLPIESERKPDEGGNEKGRAAVAAETVNKKPQAPVEVSAGKAKAVAKPKVKKTARKASGASAAKKQVKAVPAQKAETIEKVRDRKIPFTFQIPESLHKRLAYYVENYAVGRGSSIAKIIVEATDQFLAGLEKEAGIV